MKMKETQEAVIGLLTIAKIVGDVLKDGPQISDAVTLFAKLQEPEIKAKVDAALADVNLVQGEVEAAKLGDYLELFAAILPEIKGLIESVQK